MTYQGNAAAAKQLAKQLVHLRAQKDKNVKVKSQVAAVGYQTTAVQSNITMANAMKGTTKAMTTMGKQMNPQAIQQNMQQFAQESMKLDMAEDMSNKSLNVCFFSSPSPGEHSERHNRQRHGRRGGRGGVGQHHEPGAGRDWHQHGRRCESITTKIKDKQAIPTHDRCRLRQAEPQGQERAHQARPSRRTRTTRMPSFLRDLPNSNN